MRFGGSIRSLLNYWGQKAQRVEDIGGNRMPQTEIAAMSLAQLSALVQERKATPLEITEVFLQRIERLNPRSTPMF